MNNNALFWNVDTQYDFMCKEGKLYIQDAESIFPILKEITLFAYKNKIRVVNTMDWHKEGDSEISDTPDFINTFPKHCMIATKGCELVDATQFFHTGNHSYDILDIEPREILEKEKEYRNFVVYKNKFNVFKGNKNIDQLLNLLQPSVVYVYGVATNVCVHEAVVGLRKRGYPVVVFADAIKELPNIPLDSIINEWYKLNVGMINFRNLVNNYLV